MGGFPEDLQYISGLEYLLLGDNPELFVGIDEFPPALLSQEQLVAISLPNTGLSTEIPVEFGNLWELKYLILNNNQMKGGLPMEMFDMALTDR